MDCSYSGPIWIMEYSLEYDKIGIEHVLILPDKILSGIEMCITDRRQRIGL